MFCFLSSALRFCSSCAASCKATVKHTHTHTYKCFCFIFSKLQWKHLEDLNEIRCRDHFFFLLICNHPSILITTKCKFANLSFLLIPCFFDCHIAYSLHAFAFLFHIQQALIAGDILLSCVYYFTNTVGLYRSFIVLYYLKYVYWCHQSIKLY